jgi:hypothetical protein
LSAYILQNSASFSAGSTYKIYSKFGIEIEEKVCTLGVAEILARSTRTRNEPEAGVVPSTWAEETLIEDARHAPPEFKTAVFQCVGDYERCKHFYMQKAAHFDAQMGCGTAFLICTGQNLIPFVGK